MSEKINEQEIADLEKDQNRLQELKEKIRNVPARPGCYLWYGKISPQSEEQILYVGKAVKLQSRLRSYLNSDDTKTKFLMSKVTRVDWLVTDSEVEALLLESNLVKKHNPVYNIRLKDDKRYPYLCLTLGEDFPRLIITRRKQNPKHAYFGPFADVSAARNSMALIHRVFPVRKRNIKLPLNKPARPCLNYFIKRCWAPCANKVSKEEYRKMIANIQNFLEGNDSQLQEKLTQDMLDYSEKMEYEKAGRIKEILNDIKVLRGEQKVHLESPQSNYDVVGLFVADYKSLQHDLQIDSEHLDYTSADSSDFIGQIVLLQVRNGNLISKKSYAMSEYGNQTEENNSAEKTDEKTGEKNKEKNKETLGQTNSTQEQPNTKTEFLNAFFRDYYLEIMDIPSRIVVSHPTAELARWQNILREKTHREDISITAPYQINSPQNYQSNLPPKEINEATLVQDNSNSLVQTATTNAYLTLCERILNEKLRNQKLALRQIQNLLSLPVPPRVIECYDISNIQGTNPVGSGVMLKDGLPFKSGYRRYKIRDFNGADDPGMMNQMLTRRFTAIAEKRENKPDLIVIDGGITQLSAALQAREQIGVQVPIIGLAKKEEELYLENGEILDPDSESPAMLLLRLARDEAHRFGVSYHRKLRNKETLTSAVDAIKGLPKEKKVLLQEFLSKHPVENYTQEEFSALLVSYQVHAQTNEKNISSQKTKTLTKLKFTERQIKLINNYFFGE